MLITATTSPFSTAIAGIPDHTAFTLPLSGVKQSHQRLFMSQLRTRARINGNACLNELKTRFTVYWAKVPAQGSIVSRVEALLFQFEQQDLMGITARELREALLENNLKINTTTASSALATARVEVPAQEQQWIDTHWDNADHKPGLGLAQKPAVPGRVPGSETFRDAARPAERWREHLNQHAE